MYSSATVGSLILNSTKDISLLFTANFKETTLNSHLYKRLLLEIL